MRVFSIHPNELGESELAAWAALRAASGHYASPYFHPRFTQIVGRRRADARVIVIEADGRIAGFWPLHRRPDGFARPIGQPLSDQNGPILAANTPPIREIVRAAGLWGIAFTAAPAEVAALAAAEVGRGDSGLISLGKAPEATMQALAARHTGHFKSLRRRERRATEAFGTVGWRWDVTQPDTFALLMAWKHAQFARTGLFDVFATGWTQGVLEDLFAERVDGFGGVLSTLQFGDRTCAAEFGLLDGGRLHSWIAAYDPAHSAYSPGHLLLAYLIRQGPEKGVDTIELGMGADHYKKNYVTHSVALIHGVATARSLRSAMHGLPRRLWRAAEGARLGGVSELFGRARRRADNILSAELSLRGRVAGLSQALLAQKARAAAD